MKLGRYALTLEPRPTLSPLHTVLIAILAILVALALSSFIFLPGDLGPLSAYRIVFTYAFANSNGLLATVHRAI